MKTASPTISGQDGTSRRPISVRSAVLLTARCRANSSSADPGARVLPTPPPIDRNDTDINQRGKGDAFVHVDLALAAIASSDQCRCGLHARGLHRAFLFNNRVLDFPFSLPHSTICQTALLNR